MIVTIEQIKNFIKVDYADDDDLLNMIETSAEQYLKNAGIDVTTLDAGNLNLAKLYILVLVNDWYNNRALMADSKVSDKVRYTLQSILLQLQLSGSDVSA